MKHRIEKPITKLVSAVMTALLVFNLIPVGSFRTRAEGDEPLVSANYTLVYNDDVQGITPIYIGGSFELTNTADESEKHSGEVDGGRFEVTGFTDGATYSLNLKLNDATDWFCDIAGNRFFRMPVLPMNVVLNNTLSGTIVCSRIGEALYSGSVRDTEGNPVENAMVIVSSVGSYLLVIPYTGQTDSQGNYTISLPDLPGQSIKMEISKDGHSSASISAIPAEGRSFGESTLNNIKPDRTKPVISVPQSEDRFDYFDASGLGRAGVTKARIQFKDETPADPYEEVSGLKKIYIIDEALGTFEDVRQKVTDPITLDGETSYTYVFDVTPGKVYTIYAEDAQGNHSEAYTVTYQNDDQPPVYWNAGLYTNPETNDQTGITVKTDGYHSPQTVYLRFETNDTGSSVNSGVDHAEVFVKSKTSEGYDRYAVAEPNGANVCCIELTGSTFNDYRKLGVVIYDKAGNGTALMSLTDMNLQKDCLAIGSMKPVITEAVEGTSVSPIEGVPGSVFKDPPKFTFTFTDPEEIGFTDITVKVNGTVWTPETDEEILLADIPYASGTQIELCDPKDEEGNSLLKDGRNDIEVSCTSLSGSVSKSYGYILDKNPPVISKITVEPYSEGTALGITNGVVYSTGAVKVTVEAADGTTFAGLSSVTLLNDGTDYKTEAVTEGNKAVFVIPLDYSESVDYSLNISVKAKDALGNETSETILTAENSNTGTGTIYISSRKTEITLSIPAGTVIGEKTWYSAPPVLSVSAKDEFAGISKIYVSVNGREVEGSPFTFTDVPLPTEKTLETAFEAALAEESGLCHIIVTVMNGAGALTNTQKEIYLDCSAPEVDAFGLDASEGYSLNLTEHGNYANGPIEVTVSAQDDRVGIEKIVLLADGTEIAEQAPDADGTVVFTVSPEQFSSDIVRHNVSAYAVDRLGNAGDSTALIPYENSDVHSEDIVFDVTAPDVTAALAEGTPEGRTTGEGETQKVWYSSDVAWNISMSDSESGLRSYTVTLNGTELTADADGNELVTDFSESGQQFVSKSFRISTSQAGGKSDCSYELIVSATDNAGNVSEVFRQVVYIDGSAPIITEFNIATLNPDGTLYIYPYDAYANGPILVTVTAADNASGPNSGAEKILLYINGELFGEENVNPETGEAVFTVPAEELPEGYAQTLLLSAKAVDASGLTGDEKKPKEAATNIATNTVTIDTVAPTMDVSLPEQGQFVLDDQIWYKDDFEFVITGQDAQSGINMFELRINGTEITADAEGTPIPVGYGSESAPDKQLPEFRFKSEDYADSSDTIVIEAKLCDSAGNVTNVKKTIRIDRKIPVITGFALKPVAEADSLNYLRFGSFANGKVEVTVYVSDEAPSAGAGVVMLYLHTGDVAYLAAEVIDGKAVFIVPETELVSGTDEEYTFSAIPIDAVNHFGTKAELNSQTIPKMTVNLLRIENIAPTVSVEKDGTPGKTANGMQWHLSDVVWNVSIADEQSGIASVSVTMNGTKLQEDVNGQTVGSAYGEGDEAVSALQFAFSSAQAAVTAGNSVTIEITATDNAGNVSTLYKDTIYKDSTAPVIKGFKFQQQGGTESGLIAAGSSLSEMGYFFARDTVVRISAEDPDQGSGIKSITYYLKNADGTETAAQTAAADANGNVFITIKAPFKGQIFAKAADELSNTGDYASVKGIVVENPESHGAEAHITFGKGQPTGAQTNGAELYNTNVELNLRITDRYSGIKAVEWSVTAPADQARNQAAALTINENGAMNGDAGWTVLASDGKLVTDMSKTITVSNDSNDIVVRVRMRDGAGNVSERQLTFGIDKTIPTVEIGFDNNNTDADHGYIYNQPRTMTITVTERNFIAADFICGIRASDGTAPAISKWTEERDPNDPNRVVHTATVYFSADSTYNVNLSYADRAGNRAGIPAVPVFIIDRTKPVIRVSFDNNKASSENYYNQARTATVTVTERNFDVSRVSLEGNAKMGNWTANGDQHSVTLMFEKDGTYDLKISASDRAANEADPYTVDTFIIDTEAPRLSLDGIQTANGDEVAPIITCLDENYDPKGLSISLRRRRADKTVDIQAPTVTDIEEDGLTGQKFTYKNFDPTQDNDDIYTFEIKATDKAGNTSETIIKSFSVNRFGSTYDLTANKELNGKYSGLAEDIVIVETNVDEIDTDAVEITILRNNVPQKLVRGKDYSVETVDKSGQNWKEYKYVIRKDVFVQDGEYSIQIVSVDKAGNTNQNTNSKDGMVTFCIDKVAPEIIVLTPTANTNYAQPSLTASVEIRDNYKLDRVMFIVDGAVIGNGAYETDGHGLYTFEIPQSDSRQTIEIIATDAAGNERRIEIKDILVSSNLLIRFIHNPGAIVAAILILLLLLAVLILWLRYRRGNKA